MQTVRQRPGLICLIIKYLKFGAVGGAATVTHVLERFAHEKVLLRKTCVILTPNTARGFWREPTDFIENENGH